MLSGITVGNAVTTTKLLSTDATILETLFARFINVIAWMTAFLEATKQ